MWDKEATPEPESDEQGGRDGPSPAQPVVWFRALTVGQAWEALAWGCPLLFHHGHLEAHLVPDPWPGIAPFPVAGELPAYAQPLLGPSAWVLPGEEPCPL